MTVTPEELSAYADGQLPPSEAARVAALVEGDPVLQQRVERMRRAASALKSAFDDVLAQPVPPALAAMVAASPRSRAARLMWRTPPAWGAAMAACLLVAFGLGRLSAPNPAIVASPDGRVIAAGALARALDRAPSGADAGTIRIDLSFADLEGGHCRMFRTADETALAGLACGRRGDWRIVALTESVEKDRRGYAQAAGAFAPAIAQEAAARRAGDPLDAAQERAAIAAGWASDGQSRAP